MKNQIILWPQTSFHYNKQDGFVRYVGNVILATDGTITCAKSDTGAK